MIVDLSAPPHPIGMHYEDRARRVNLVIGLALGTLIGGALALLAQADIRIRRPPTTRERMVAWRGELRDRAMAAAADAVSTMTGAIVSAPERLRG